MIPERRPKLDWFEGETVEGRGYNSKTGKYDCTDCGACCVPGDARMKDYVYLHLKGDRDNPERMKVLGPISQERTSPSFKGEAYLLTSIGFCGRQCIAFRGEVGGKAHCSVYEDRPEVCRKFKPGGDACREVRSLTFGDEP